MNIDWRDIWLGTIFVAMIVLAAILGRPRLSSGREGASLAVCRAQLAAFSDALSKYKMDMGTFPNTAEGLRALLIDQGNTSHRPAWKGPYLDTQSPEVPNDPWGNSYIYVFPGTRNKNSYDLCSVGPDGQPGTEDDVFQ